MQSKPLGLSPVDMNTIYVTFGAGKPLMYAETGMAVSAHFGRKLHERDFRPRFLSLCQRGLISFAGWDELGKDIRARIVVDIPKCVDVIREVQIYLGGDYSYYKYFDPYVDYEKNPEKMDRFLKGPMTIESDARKIEKKKLFEAQHKAHLRDPKNNRWF
jgi:hypothetical protein